MRLPEVYIPHMVSAIPPIVLEAVSYIRECCPFSWHAVLLGKMVCQCLMAVEGLMTSAPHTLMRFVLRDVAGHMA